jgi:hypothetical protein
MSATAATRVVLSNLVHDLLQNRVSSEAVLVIREVVEEWDRTHPGSATPTADNARDAAMLLESKLDGGAGIRFCSGTSIPADELLSRVTDEKALWDFLLQSSPFGEPADRDASSFSPQDVIELADAHIKSGARITGRRPVAWVTKRSVIEHFIDDLDEADVATRARDFLGLDHYDERHRLVEILYPDTYPAELELHAPTVIEGACKKVYRSVSSIEDQWGRAVDLSTKAEDGAPEAVHPPIDFTAKFNLRFLGDVRPEAPPFTDADLADACPRPWRTGDDDMLQRWFEENCP